MVEDKIVIVVNDTDISQKLEEKLKKSGYSVLVSDPKKEAALLLVLQNNPSLIVISPKLDSDYAGIELAKQIKEKFEVPIVFISLTTNKDAYLKAKALNPIAYFTDPFNIENLISTIEIGLENFDLQKKTKALFLKSLEELKENNNSKDKFLSIISHDLRNPFNSLLGLTELLAYNIDDFTEQEIKDSAVSLNLTAHNLFNLLTNLLEWSKLKTGNFTIEKSEFTLSQIINYILDVFSDSTNARQIKIIKEIDCEIWVTADRTMIETALKNIISNAIRYTHDGGIITVGCKLNEDYAEIFVKDNGVGIPEENQKRLFKIEKRFLTEGINNDKGTGFGLLLCKELIEQNNGNIKYKSEVGKGSIFIISLPINSV